MREVDEKYCSGTGKVGEGQLSTIPVALQMLVIGNLQEWQDAGRDLPTGKGLYFANFHDLTPALLSTLNPDVVLAPMVGRHFDCLDLAQVLQTCNFKGRLRVVAPRLPNPGIILAEIRSLCPSLDFGFSHIGYEN